MNRTLSNILTIFKIARVLAKIVFICCIIGGVCCLLGLFMLPMVEAVMPDTILAETGLDIDAARLAMIVAIVSCIGEAVFAFLAERYFKSVLDAQTPFTFNSAKECFRLGVTSLIISAAVSIISAIVSSVIVAIAQLNVLESNFSTSITLSTGLFFMFISMLFKYGAEQQENLSEETPKE